MHLNIYCRCWPILLLGLVGCRPAPPESHLTDPFLESLRTAGEKVNGDNRTLFNALRYEVGIGGRRNEDMDVVKQAEQLREASAALRQALDSLNRTLSSVPPVADWPDSIRVRIKALSVHLARFTARLAGLSEKKRPFFPGLPGQDTLHPLEDHLRTRSVGDVRLALAQLRAEVAMAEEEALDRLASKVGSLCCFCFTRITPVAVATSSTVRAGDPYEAVLFLGAGYRSGWHLWSATLNGVTVPVLTVPVLTEKLEVHIPSGRIPAKGSDSLQITLHLVGKYGRDSTLVIRRSYPAIVRAATHLSPAIQP